MKDSAILKEVQRGIAAEGLTRRSDMRINLSCIRATRPLRKGSGRFDAGTIHVIMGPRGKARTVQSNRNRLLCTCTVDLER